MTPPPVADLQPFGGPLVHVLQHEVVLADVVELVEVDGGRLEVPARLATGRKFITMHPCVFSIRNHPAQNIQGGAGITLRPMAKPAGSSTFVNSA